MASWLHRARGGDTPGLFHGRARGGALLAASLLALLTACTSAPRRPAELPGWGEDRLSEALPVFIAGCRRPAAALPEALCGEAEAIPAGDDAAARAFFDGRFTPRLAGEGLMTGYFEPELRGRLERPAHGQGAPLRGRPEDLVEADLGRFAESLRGRRVAGRVRDGRLEPYPDRAAIEAGESPAPILLWAEDAADKFFLQIQGSGRVVLPDGTVRRMGYAAANGRAYVPIGRLLAERGEIPRGQVSMQSILAWLHAAGPERARALMDENPSYVFFREVPARPEQGPTGSLGVPLTPLRSLAVDREHILLGRPVWIEVAHPVDGQRLRRLVIAQDTGGAIKGEARADLFWGWGDAAREAAGLMQGRATLTVLEPAAP
ncbi:murein transglycosylase A [Pseudoroseomonas cervicalis]|uniref:peptidoglycan lytic exotransglycosylase n=1 Tax=Pseudoroseomonas cervicalis ATCC 49957 TaxID=525371 RepID=D5RNY4_9PROT|nr:MltA domain-containing protein [Pseudoroseomonas cervicalis]EFH10985.1 MltA specific insert domain protein [Pseudoroseomonas cervicalis ATCC 49957]